MIFIQRSIRGSLVALIAACGFAVAGQLPDAGSLTLAAVAADAEAAVFKDAQGALHTIAVGVSLPGGAWRLTGVRGDAAVLTAAQGIDGRDVTMTLPLGARVTPAAVAAIDAAREKPRVTNVMVVPAKAPSAKDKTEKKKAAREGQR